MKIITVYNAKGGVWKTSIIHNLGYSLSNMGYKVLMIDLDQQASLTISCGIEPDKAVYTSYNFLTDNKICLKPINLKNNLDLLPSDLQLSLLDKTLIQLKNQSIILKRRLIEVGFYDYILIDTPPALSAISANAVYACDLLLSPIDCSYLSYVGLKTVEDTVKKFNKKIDGIVATRYNQRTTDSKTIVNLLEKKYNLVGKISESVKAKEALYYGVPIVEYMPKHKISNQYIDLAKNIIRSC